MNKPVLTKEQAKAVDALLDVWKGKPEYGRTVLVEEKLTDGWDGEFGDAESISDDDFIAAIYVGYVVEKTPEEKIRDYYRRSERMYGIFGPDDGSEYKERMASVKYVLTTLGIKIEGVNA